ncbi:TetR family transcriptional regulator [Cupriavidus sp. TA19]|uniref:TetR/AcrR family transcriptional regulator n=1 Tax=Cupriavidus sp. TA19 TaxID=701108 RepID=UPI0027294C1A|nr:TetR/AcrR family transcriptional regulator [Cupriavidus sp. TA19]GLC94275.1 TetR family transcriptional regulator [Cupriavidus sp. TA19]
MEKVLGIPQRTRVVRAAAELFAERGYHAVAMSDIQQAVGLGRGALYHHIRSKEDLLYDIVREYIADLVEFAAGLSRDRDPRERVRLLGSHLIEKIASNKPELTVCFREVQSLTGERQGEVVKLHAAYERAWRDVYVDGAEVGVFRPYDPIVLKALVGMYFHSFLWIKPNGALRPAEVADRLNSMALQALAPMPPTEAV